MKRFLYVIHNILGEPECFKGSNSLLFIIQNAL